MTPGDNAAHGPLRGLAVVGHKQYEKDGRCPRGTDIVNGKVCQRKEQNGDEQHNPDAFALGKACLPDFPAQENLLGLSCKIGKDRAQQHAACTRHNIEDQKSILRGGDGIDGQQRDRRAEHRDKVASSARQQP